MNANLTIDASVAEVHKEIQLKHMHQWCTAAITDNNTVVRIDKKGEKGSSIADLKAALPDNEVRYILLDHNNKLWFIMWCPENLGVKQKMVAASTRLQVKGVFGGCKADSDVREASDWAGVEAKMNA